jgi:hypothetical protein
LIFTPARLDVNCRTLYLGAYVNDKAGSRIIWMHSAISLEINCAKITVQTTVKLLEVVRDSINTVDFVIKRKKLVPLKFLFSFPILVPSTQSTAQAGDRAFLPCEVISSGSRDDIFLVLWFKDNATKPMYRWGFEPVSLCPAAVCQFGVAYMRWNS